MPSLDSSSNSSSGGTAPDALYRSVHTNNDQQPSSKTVLSTTATCLAIFKGNIGPGILNLPRAFALTGYGLGSLLFIAIGLQGIYSMWLLVECQRYISSNRRLTFMDIAEHAFGGGRIVEILLFILQGGVCCVFLSLISTNLHAAIPHYVSYVHAVLFVALYMVVSSTLREIKDLFYLNATANLFMVLAIVTAIAAGMIMAHDNAHARFAKPGLSNVIFFTSDLFFAFEGIGLVLPIENAYDHANNRMSFSFVLVSSMALVALAFGVTGVAGSIGFNVQTGSITAFLHEEYPNVLWYSIVNVLVIVAVALTFPLQLAPAAQVLEGWMNKSANIVELDASETSMMPINATTPEETNHETTSEHSPSSPPAPITEGADEIRQTRTGYGWLYQRWGLVVMFTIIVLAVDDLSLLMGLFGAVGQTGLAGMPCAIHLALQYQGRAPRNIWMSVLDILILILTAIVMVAGCIVSLHQIVTAH